jgi:hypothetical protein
MKNVDIGMLFLSRQLEQECAETLQTLDGYLKALGYLQTTLDIRKCCE